jgi:hypothetical protein
MVRHTREGSSRFTVEFGDDRNRNPILVLTKKVMRGRWSMANLVGEAFGDMAPMPDIPGIHAEVDVGAKTLRIFDPLATDKDLYDKVCVVLKNARQEFGKPWPEVTRKLDENELKTICLELLDHIDAGTARRIDGRVPTREEINGWPGRRMINQMDSNQAAPRFQGDIDRRHPQIIGVATHE